MAYVWKLVCGDETLQLHGTDNSTYKVLDSDVRWTAGEMRLPIAINRTGGGAVGTMQRLDREIRRFMQKAAAWADRREGKPVDLVCKIDDGLGDIEPLYGRGMSRLRVLAGRSNLAALMPKAASRGTIVAELTLYARPYFHGKLMDVADATGWVREAPEKGLEVWEGTTNLLVNPCLAFATDWDQRWAAYNTTDLVASQSTSIWRSLGSCAKLRASATLPGVFYDDITLTNAAHVLSCYVHKEGAAPTTNDVALWAGHVFENFTTAAAAPTAPLVEAVAGGGNVVIAGGECQLDSSAAAADGAIVYYNAAIDADKIFRIRTRFRCPTVSNILSCVLSLVDKAAVPAITAGGAMSGGGNREIVVYQDTTGAIKTGYMDNGGNWQSWNAATAAWVAGFGAGTAVAGALGTTYRADVISNGTSWYVVIYDANDAVLTTTTAVTWALTRAIVNSLYYFSGDDDTTNYQSDMYLDYVKIDVGALTTTFSAEDPEHPDWYRATSTAFTMPSTTVCCGVEVKAGRYVYVDDLQVEAMSYATPFANGDLLGCAWTGTAHDSTTTRTAGQCALGVSEAAYPQSQRPLIGDHGSLTLWYKPGLSSTSQPNSVLFDAYFTAANQIELYWDSVGGNFECNFNGTLELQAAASTFSAGQEIFIGLTWDFTADSYYIYIDDATGVQGTTAMVAPILLRLYFGQSHIGSYQANGVIYDLRTWEDVLSSAQIAAVREAGRGLGELPWCSKSGVLSGNSAENVEDSTRRGSFHIGGIPGELPPGIKMAVFNDTAAASKYYIAAKALDRGEYQYKYPYVLEGETITNWSGGAATVADADHSNGNYRTDTASSDPYGYIVPTTLDLHRLVGRWRVFARAACTGANTADWNIAIEDLRCTNTYPTSRRWPTVDVAGNNTVDQYNWLDLGTIDIPPSQIPDASIYQPVFPISGTSNYMRITLDVNEAAAAETFRMDCLELLPDEHLAVLTPASSTTAKVLLDTTGGGPIACAITYPGESNDGAKATGDFALSPQCVNRIILRVITGTSTISAGTGGSSVGITPLEIQVEPRFEALR